MLRMLTFSLPAPVPMTAGPGWKPPESSVSVVAPTLAAAARL